MTLHTVTLTWDAQNGITNLSSLPANALCTSVSTRSNLLLTLTGELHWSCSPTDHRSTSRTSPTGSSARMKRR